MTPPAFVHGTSCVGEPPARPYKNTLGNPTAN